MSLRGVTSYVEAAERDGSIKQYTDQVLEVTLKDWRSVGRAGVGLSVNLAYGNLAETDLPKRVQKALKRHRIDPGALWLEVDARAQLISDPMPVTMRRLADLGVRFSIDSFGEDYSASTLYEVGRLPVAELKVDPRFVADADTNMTHRNFIAHTISMAQQQRVSVSAKGIERENIAALMARLGLTYGQGYYFARPVSVAAVGAVCDAPHEAGAT